MSYEANLPEPDRLREVVLQFVETEKPGTPRTTREIADAVGCSRRTAYNRLQTLVDRGHLETKKVGSRGRVWWRPATMRTERSPFDDADAGAESEPDQLITALNRLSGGFLTVDSAWTVTYINERACELVGRDRSALVDENLWEAVPELAETPIQARCEDALRSTDPTRFETYSGALDSWFQVSLHPAEDGLSIYVHNIDERKEERRALEQRVEQHEVVADLVDRLLSGEDFDRLCERTTNALVETLDAEYCAILDRQRGRGEFVVRADAGWDDGIHGTTVEIDKGSQTGFALGSVDPVVVENVDHEPRFSDPDLFDDRRVKSGISVVIGPVEDPWGVLTAHSTAVRDFSDDAGFVQTIATQIWGAIQRKHHLERLDALNDLNTVIREIGQAFTSKSTRRGIEELACERLAASDSYEFAWLADVDLTSKSVVGQVEAGVDGYVDDLSLSIDTDDPSSRNPACQAALTGDVQTISTARDDEKPPGWMANADEYGFEASAAIPIQHQNTIYGVLNLYSARDDAFSQQEREIVEELGTILGHAITSVDRKQALMGDNVVEIEFRLSDLFATLGISSSPTGDVHLDQIVPVDEGEYLIYGSATEEMTDPIRLLVDSLDHWKDATFFESLTAETSFELRVVDPPVISIVGGHGGYVDEAVIEDSEYRMRIHLPVTVNVRRVIREIKKQYPVELVSRRRLTQIDRTVTDTSIFSRLTDRQATVLEVAFHSGYFEWPRRSTAQEVAESLGISPPTFHQHIRNAEEEVITALFET